MISRCRKSWHNPVGEAATAGLFHQSVLQNLTADRDAAKLSMVKSHADLLHTVELELTCRGQGGQHGPKNPVLALPGSF